MNKDLRERVIRFRSSMAVLQEMVTKSIISHDDLLTIATKIAEKNGLSSSTIFTDIDLLYNQINGNM